MNIDINSAGYLQQTINDEILWLEKIIPNAPPAIQKDFQILVEERKRALESITDELNKLTITLSDVVLELVTKIGNATLIDEIKPEAVAESKETVEVLMK